MSVQEDKLQGIADAIRTVKGGTDLIPASEFESEIEGLKCQTIKTVFPEAQNSLQIKPDSGYFGMRSAYINSPNGLVESNIKKGIKLFGITGTLDTPTGTSTIGFNPSLFNTQSWSASYNAYVSVSTSFINPSYNVGSKQVTMTLRHKITLFTRTSTASSWVQKNSYNHDQVITIKLT